MGPSNGPMVVTLSNAVSFHMIMPYKDPDMSFQNPGFSKPPILWSGDLGFFDDQSYSCLRRCNWILRLPKNRICNIPIKQSQRQERKICRASSQEYGTRGNAARPFPTCPEGKHDERFAHPFLPYGRTPTTFEGGQQSVATIPRLRLQLREGLQRPRDWEAQCEGEHVRCCSSWTSFICTKMIQNAGTEPYKAIFWWVGKLPLHKPYPYSIIGEGSSILGAWNVCNAPRFGARSCTWFRSSSSL